MTNGNYRSTNCNDKKNFWQCQLIYTSKYAQMWNL